MSEHLDITHTPSQLTWLKERGLTVPPTCATCGGKVQWKYGPPRYATYCSNTCSNSNASKIDKTKRSNLAKYGHSNPLGDSHIAAVALASKIRRYGVGNSTNSVQTRMTKMLRYGDENYCNREQANKTCAERYGHCSPLSNKQIRGKALETWIDKFGVDNPMKSESVKSKQQNTNTELYGTPYHQQSEEGKRARADASLLKYGVVSPLLSHYARERARDSMLERHGVSNPSHVFHSHIPPILHMLNDSTWLETEHQTKTLTTIAKILGVDPTTVGNYMRKHGLSVRQFAKHSDMAIDWLNKIAAKEGIYIQHAGNSTEFAIPGTKFTADGYCKETNTIYEFHGDYWHGNPDVYPEDIMNEVVGKPMGLLYDSTISREHIIRSLGYNLVVVWENDYPAFLTQ